MYYTTYRVCLSLFVLNINFSNIFTNMLSKDIGLFSRIVFIPFLI